MVWPSLCVMVPSTVATRRRSVRAGVLSERCALESAYADDAAARAARCSVSACRVVPDQDGKCAPRESEGDVGVEPAAEQLEAVRAGDDDSDEDERGQTESDSGQPDDAQGDGAGKAGGSGGGEEPTGDRGAQRAAVELVEGVRGHPHSEEEGEQGGCKAATVEVGREGCADGDVREVPRRVGRVKQEPTSRTTRASSFPAERRRRPEGVGAVRLPRLTGPDAVPVAFSAAAPHDESAAETHAAYADVDQPGRFHAATVASTEKRR